MSCDRPPEPGASLWLWDGEEGTRPNCAVSETSPGQNPGHRMDQGPLVFPQGKEEICKEEVVESEEQWMRADTLTYKRRGHGTP